jgi:putative RecB family exonuclease
MSITVDPPMKLPVEQLSVSSLNLLTKCPTRWKRRYIDREYEPPSGAMLLGSAVGSAEAQHYGHIIETGEGLTLEEVEDEFSGEWDARIFREEAIDWGESSPGELKDQGIAVLERYHVDVAPQVVPVSVEREFKLSWPGVDWGLTGFLDLEEADGAVADLKVRSRKLSKTDADTDLQAAAYLLARRAEQNPAPEFRFHVMTRTKRPAAEIVATQRTDRQLDSFTDRLFAAAAEIAWRTETDMWSGAVPGSWWCSQRFCGYWDSCKFGGLR